MGDGYDHKKVVLRVLVLMIRQSPSGTAGQRRTARATFPFKNSQACLLAAPQPHTSVLMRWNIFTVDGDASLRCSLQTWEKAEQSHHTLHGKEAALQGHPSLCCWSGWGSDLLTSPPPHRYWGGCASFPCQLGYSPEPETTPTSLKEDLLRRIVNSVSWRTERANIEHLGIRR